MFLPGLVLTQVLEAGRSLLPRLLLRCAGVEAHHHLQARLWGPGVEGEVQKGQSDVENPVFQVGDGCAAHGCDGVINGVLFPDGFEIKPFSHFLISGFKFWNPGPTRTSPATPTWVMTNTARHSRNDIFIVRFHLCHFWNLYFCSNGNEAIDRIH